MLHFAYGSNMYRAVMRRHAPEARALGVARLEHHRFVITADGYASVVPARSHVVHGMMWQLTPRDRVTLDLRENTAGGLYRAETVPVHFAGTLRPALVYVARRRPDGVPKPGYMEIVVKAARALDLPAEYIAALEQWRPKRASGAGHRKLEPFE